jgi:spermidine/putrescine-binding protein
VTVALAVAAGFWACEKKHAVLTVLIWSDYINPTLIAEFQQLTGCTVRLEIYSNNEELKAMLREGRFAADVIVPSSYEIQTLQHEGFLMRLNDRKLENRKHIDEKM